MRRSVMVVVVMPVVFALTGAVVGSARGQGPASGSPPPAPVAVRVDAGAPRVEVSPKLYGVFFEEINHAGEGGLYAELVQNRDFEANTIPPGTTWAGNVVRTPKGWYERKWFTSELHGWSLVADGGARGSIRQETSLPLNDRNPRSMRLVARDLGSRIGVANEGFWGMNVVSGERYDLSFYARTEPGKSFDLTATLEDRVGRRTYAKAEIKGVAGGWTRYSCKLTADGSDPKARLVLITSTPGTVWFDVVSLFPENTYKGHGLRKDLMEALAAMKPAFIRFPGGCIVEGMMLNNRFQWKNSIGEISQRKGTVDLWAYYNTFGLGFHEYLQMCEDLEAEALYVVNTGLSCQYRNAEVCKEEEVEGYIQDTLDALEYATGPADSAWGAKRAAAGHPAPFSIKYVEIGNENRGPDYYKRYKRFFDAIKARFPKVVTIADERLPADMTAEIVDDHYYNQPEFFFNNNALYDPGKRLGDRKGPKIYVGEYACNGGVGEGNLRGAISEAVFMLGMERNSDLVLMCSYAPLFFNVHDIAWPVNMIGFDSSRWVGRTTYHVEKLFGANRPDVALETRVDDPAREVFALAGLDKSRNELVLKLVNKAGASRSVAVSLKGLDQVAATAKVQTLSHDDPTAENTLDDPEAVVPVASELTGVDTEFPVTLKPNSLTILRVPARDASR